LRAKNEKVVLISAGTEFLALPGGDFTVNPQRRDEFDRVFVEAQLNLKSQLLGVVNFWPVDAVTTEATTPAEWETLQGQLSASVIHAAQALLSTTAAGGAPAPKLSFVTRGAQNVRRTAQVAPENIQPLQAMAWGLARVISLELPALFGAIIDLDAAAEPAAQAAGLLLELSRSDPDDAIAYRNRQRFVPRIIRAKEPAGSRQLKLKKTASYLITGGLGGLGLHAMQWLAERAAGQIILVSRRGFPARGQWAQLAPDDPSYKAVSAVLKAEKNGARVTVVRADVADENAMAGLFARFGKEFPPLRGLIHAAVDMSNCSIDTMAPAQFQAMARAKAVGGWVLHRMTRSLELDFCVFFSSTTALWGVAGLGHYAAANQALDAIATMRRARGLPALSICWGTWAEMRVADEQDKKIFAQAGLRPMDVGRALAALESLILGGESVAIVASIEWPALCAIYEARRARPIFQEMRLASRSASAKDNRPASNAESEIVKRLREASGNRRRDILVAHLRSQAAAVLGFDATREIPLDLGLFDMGMDSLMSVELKGRLERSFSVPLPSTLTFNYPTIEALCDFLLNDALSIGIQPVPPEAAPKIQVVIRPSKVKTPDYEDMTEDDLEQELMRRLKGLK
jgi:NAD(P)-dependent dehydrogenase (short-subunit alcohol dehydrogenase family)/acyl carrier protein